MGAKRRKRESETVQGICVSCDERPQRKNRLNAAGEQTYSALCGVCSHKRNPQKTKSIRPPNYWWAWEKYRYTSVKGDSCVKCGFVAEDPCQLDVDHIDGDHSNDDPANLQTLCANCHRLKTKLNGDGIYRFNNSTPISIEATHHGHPS